MCIRDRSRGGGGEAESTMQFAVHTRALGLSKNLVGVWSEEHRASTTAASLGERLLLGMWRVCGLASRRATGASRLLSTSPAGRPPADRPSAETVRQLAESAKIQEKMWNVFIPERGVRFGDKCAPARQACSRRHALSSLPAPCVPGGSGCCSAL